MKKLLLVAFLFLSLKTFPQILIGNANNSVSAIAFHPMLDCNPQLNMVSFVYASAPAGNPAKVFVNYSTNSGDTWQNVGNTIFNNPSTISPPQYPNTFIYNPPGNTVADSAYLHWLSPVQISGSYQAFRYGSSHPANLPSTIINTSSLPGVNIPVDGVITQQGETYLLFPPVSGGSLTIPDSMHILHGVWNNTNHEMIYTSSALAMPLNLGGNNVFSYRTGGIAFANNGWTGYIYLLAHHEYSFANDSSSYPIIYKTTDGGLTWSTPMVLNLNNIHSILLTSPTGKYSAGFEVDGTVDANGDLHFVTAVAPLLANNKMDVNGGQWGLFDIYTDDGGTTWHAELIDKPLTNNVTYGGGITTYSRAQTSRNWSGDHLFFGWFDTDTLIYGTSNTHPNFFVKGYDFNTHQWTTTVNKTAATSASALCLFGIVALYVLENGSQYEIPVTVALGSGGPSIPSDYYYLNNMFIDSTTFNQTGNPVTLSNSMVAVEETEAQDNISAVVYPNPANDNASFYVMSKTNTSITYELVNSLGETVYYSNDKKLKPGRNDFDIDTKFLKAGIFILHIKANCSLLSKKVVIKH